jgi:hypothetical protein
VGGSGTGLSRAVARLLAGEAVDTALTAGREVKWQMAGSNPTMAPPLNRSVIGLTPLRPCAAGYRAHLMASLVRVSIHAASAADRIAR